MKQIKSIFICCIIGIILGSITEYALIYNIKWLITITQSFLFWGLVMLISASISKKFYNTVLFPTIIISLMNTVYYLIRLNMSGYTNVGAWKLYSILGLSGSMYIGTTVYCIKQKIKYKKIDNCIPKYCWILMTILAIFLTILYNFGVFHISSIWFGNYIYAPMMYGNIIGFIGGIILGNIQNSKEEK